MVIEHDIRRCAGILVHSFEAVHGGFGAGRPVLNVKADVIVIGINLLPSVYTNRKLQVQVGHLQVERGSKINPIGAYAAVQAA